MKLNLHFYPLTKEYTKKLRELNLTKSEWKIWSYLITLDPYGDRYVTLDTLTIMEQCEISKATFYRAIAKFQDHNLFDFQDKGFNFINKMGVSKIRKLSQNCEKSLKTETEILKTETELSEMRQNSQICKNQSLKPSDSKASKIPQTSSDLSRLSHTSSEEKIQEKEGVILNKEEAIANELMEKARLEEERLIQEAIAEVISDDLNEKEQLKVEPITKPNNNSSEGCKTHADNVESPTGFEVFKEFSDLPIEFIEWKAKDWANYFKYSYEKAIANLTNCFYGNRNKCKGYYQAWLIIKEQDKGLVEFEGKKITPEKKAEILKERSIPVNPQAVEVLNAFLGKKQTS